MFSWKRWALVLCWIAAGCQPDPCLDDGSVAPFCSPPSWVVATPVTTVLEGATAPAVDSDDMQLPYAVVALVPLPDGGVLVGTSAGVYLADDKALFEVDLYAGDAFADEGAVSAMTLRPEGGVLVASAAGLLHTYGSALLPSPVDGLLEGMAIQHLAVSGMSAVDEVAWIGAEDGLYRVWNGQVDQVQVDGWSTGPDALVATADRVIVAWSDRVYELLDHGDRWKLILAHAPVDELALSGDQAWARTDAGLLAERPDGRWRLHTLSGSEIPVAVQALTRGAEGFVWAAVEGGLGHLDGTDLIQQVASVMTVQALAEDTWGDLWAASETWLTVHRTGRVVGFETDIAPTLAAFCNGCHLSGSEAPLRDFSDYGTVVSLADTIVEKIGTGLMPPAPIPSLDEESWKLLVRWYTTGQSP